MKSFFGKDSEISLQLVGTLLNKWIVMIRGLKYVRKCILYMGHCFPEVLVSPSPSPLQGAGLFMQKAMICIRPYLKLKWKEKWIREDEIARNMLELFSGFRSRIT